MKKENKKILITLLVIIIMGVTSYFGYQRYKKELPREDGKTGKEIVIKELAEKYDALANWNKHIYYTIQLQDLLVNSGKPVLFTGFVDDVFIKENQYYVRFLTGGHWTFNFSESPICFVLKCDLSKVSEIIDRMKDRITKTDADLHTSEFRWLESLLWKYAVVAKIENITKPILEISTYPAGENEEVELEYKPSSTFIASGTCIDFFYIGEDNSNISN